VKRFDAIVVGAGPAGSTAAYRLARAGASVLLLDRARFPRDKPCGGGLTGRALRLLPFSVDPVVENAVDRFEFRLRYGRRFERRSRSPLVLMTQRRRLDAYLAERAAEAGADFRDGARATTVAERDGVVTVRVNGERMEAGAVIGADGVNGITARSLGLAGNFRYGVALEGNVRYGVLPEEEYRAHAVLELAVLPGGYGWVFPKGDHANVGVGGWEEEAPRLRAELVRLCARHGVAGDRLEDVRGYRLPLRRRSDPVAGGRALLVGDAAGLVDPLSGDGIYEAFLSSKLAAEAVLDLLAGRASSLDPYAVALERALARQSSASWAAKRAFDRFPRSAFALARAPLVWDFVEGLLRGDLPEPSAARGPVRVPLKALDALGSGSARAASRYTGPAWRRSSVG
jgi:geranylgeranyl reductase family protein